MPKQYPRDFRERAVRLVTESRPHYETESSTIGQVGTLLGVGPEPLSKWVHQEEVNAGLHPGVSESENVEVPRLKKEVTELRQMDEVLRTAPAFFAAKLLTDPPVDDPIRRFVS